MADGIGATLEGLPPWLVPAAAIGLALLLALRGNSGGSGGGSVTSLTPIAADPGLIALQTSQSADKLSAFTSLANLVGTENVSGLSANRDITIAGYNLAGQESTNQANLDAALAGYAVQQNLGLAVTSAQRDAELAATAGQTSVALDTNATNKSVSLAQLQSARDVAGAQKAVSKNNMWGDIVGSISGAVTSLFGHF